MTIEPTDELFAQHILRSRIISAEQLEAARAEQAQLSLTGEPVSLAAVLVRQGMLTEAILENVSKSMLEAPKSGPQSIGQYKMVRKLGEGGMGTVYLAEDTVAQRPVALKLLPKKLAAKPDLVARFKREAKSAGRLNHPNVVAAYTTGEEKGMYFYVMEYCEGEPLDKILKRDKQLEWDVGVDYTLQIARGLSHAHNLGIIHRDIKPSNIFITQDDVAKILDMGLSKNILDSEQSFNTISGMALGTPHYISPEQAKGEKDIDGRTDIYSLGATLYHLLTGETPYQGGTPAVIMMKHLNERLQNPQDINPGIPDGVVRIIQKMMTKESADRYRNCAELIADLERVASGHNPINADVEEEKTSVRMRAIPRTAADAAKAKKPAISRIPARPRPPGQRPLKREKLPVIAAIVSAALALILVLIYALSGKKSESAPGKTARTVPQTTMPSTLPAPTPILSDTAEGTPSKARTAAEIEKERLDDSARWKNAIDLLKLADPAKDKINGTWKFSDDGFLAGYDPFARMEFPYTPPEEYDIRIVFERVGRNAPLHLLLTRGKAAFSCVLGAGELAGVENIYGMDVATLNKREHPQALALTIGVRRTAVCMVRGNAIRLLVDGEPVFNIRATDEMLSRSENWKLDDNRHIGLGTAGDGIKVERFEVLDIRGKGVFARPDDAAAKDAEKKRHDIIASEPAPPPLAENNAAWNVFLPFDLSGLFNADVISSDTHVAVDSFKPDVISSWTTASWLRANEKTEKKDRKESGLPDDGLIKIPKSPSLSYFRLGVPPAKNAVLFTSSKGRYPKPAVFQLPDHQRRKYAQLAVLHGGACGDGRVRMVLKYASGPNVTVSLKIEDWHPQYRLPMAQTEKVAVATLTTRGNPAEMCSQIVPADPARILESLTFSFEPIESAAAEEVPHDERFTAGIFAVSAQPSGK